MAKKAPKKRLIYFSLTRKGTRRFSSRARARIVRAGKFEFIIPPRATKKEKARVLARAQRRLNRATFNEKVSKQVKPVSEKVGRFRTETEVKTLNVPNTLKTFDIRKHYFVLDNPIRIDLSVIHSQIRILKRNSKSFFLDIFNQNQGANFLFRIDTAYSDADGFSRVNAYYKPGKDGLSDGRGFSIGRHLALEEEEEFWEYLNNTFSSFLEAFKTYMARKGIIHGQINALTLEVS